MALEQGSVISNTPWWKTRKALEVQGARSQKTIEEFDKNYREEQCMPVRAIAKACFDVAYLAAQPCKRITTSVTSVERKEDIWKVTHTFGFHEVKKLFLCSGATPKTLDVSLPTIPLSIALDLRQLHTQVSSSDSVVVFGTAHSGVICLSNLNTLGVKTTAVFKGEKPFRFEREGVQDGLKEGSAQTADEILQGKQKNLSLISWSNPLDLQKVLSTATKVIHATGFLARPVRGIESLEQEPSTAALNGQTNLQGQGIAFPGISEVDGKRQTDVSVLSFQDQIQRTLTQNLSQ